MDNYSGAYMIPRRRNGGGRKPPHRRRPAAVALIVLLLLLTAGIISLAVILPHLPTDGEKAGGGAATVHTFYLLAMGSADNYTEAAVVVNDVIARGGGGFVFNDGKYNIIAAAYSREAEAKAVAEINDGAYYITLDIPESSNASDAEIVRYICGEYFTELTGIAAALDRGTVTAAAADKVVYGKIMRLGAMVENGASAELAFALGECVDYEAGGGNRSQLSYIRFVTTSALVGAYNGLSALAR